MENYSDLLISFNIKPSKHRLAIIKYLIMNDNHPDTNEVFTELYPNISKLSMGTVYNTLKLFADKGIIHSLYIDGIVIRYDACLKPHDHFYCKICKKIYNLPFGTTTHNVNEIKHEIYSSQTNYVGICEECLAKEHSQNNP